MICLECGGEMREIGGPIVECYKGREYTVQNVTRYECEKCGERVMSAEEADRVAKSIADMHRRSEGLLLPEEIRGVRERLGLRQRDFESLLGVSSPTASRWETGAMLQSKTADKLMRVLSAHPEIAGELSGPTVTASSWSGRLEVIEGGRKPRGKAAVQEFVLQKEM